MAPGGFISVTLGGDPTMLGEGVGNAFLLAHATSPPKGSAPVTVLELYSSSRSTVQKSS